MKKVNHSIYLFLSRYSNGILLTTDWHALFTIFEKIREITFFYT